MARRVKICPNCGEKWGRLERFCGKCPTSLAGVQEVTDLDDGLGTPQRESFKPNVPLSLQEAHCGTTRLEGGTGIIECFDEPHLKFHLIGGGTIGRSGAEVDLTPLPRSGAITNCHARILYDGVCWYIEDLSSTNGTWIDGRKLAPHVREQLVPGHRFTLANTTFTFRIE